MYQAVWFCSAKQQPMFRKLAIGLQVAHPWPKLKSSEVWNKSSWIQSNILGKCDTKLEVCRYNCLLQSECFFHFTAISVMIGFSWKNKLTELDRLLDKKFSNTTGEVLTAFTICERMIMLVYSPLRDFYKV